MQHISKTLLAMALVATGTAFAATASASLLQLRVTDPATGTLFICVDNAACDASDTIDDEIVLDTLLANTFLGFSSAFNVASLAAQSNFVIGDPLISNIIGSGGIRADATFAEPRPRIIAFSQADWSKPDINPRTMSRGPTVAFARSVPGAPLDAQGDNGPDNLWDGKSPFDGTVFVDPPVGSADEFVTPQVLPRSR